MFDIYMNGRISEEEDLFFLQKFKTYSKIKCILHFDYSFIRLPELRDFFSYDLLRPVMEQDFKQMIRIMVAVHNILIPDGSTIPIHPMNAINILHQTQKNHIGSNCWMYAVVLNEIFLSLGIRSRMIRCMPFDLRFNDCHCVVQAYSNEYRKWILFDPAFGTYYANMNRMPINIQEFREAIINGEKILSALVPLSKSKDLIKYWTKNLFRFESYSLSKFNVEDSEENLVVYSLLPEGYEIKNRINTSRNRIVKIEHIHNANAFWEG